MNWFELTTLLLFFDPIALLKLTFPLVWYANNKSSLEYQMRPCILQVSQPTGIYSQ